MKSTASLENSSSVDSYRLPEPCLCDMVTFVLSKQGVIGQAKGTEMQGSWITCYLTSACQQRVGVGVFLGCLHHLSYDHGLVVLHSLPHLF